MTAACAGAATAADLNGSGGDDVLRGRAARDVLAGDAGDDELHGGPGPDRVDAPGCGRERQAQRRRHRPRPAVRRAGDDYLESNYGLDLASWVNRWGAVPGRTPAV